MSLVNFGIDRGFTPLSPEEQKQQIASLHQQMQAHDGELFLVVHRQWEPFNAGYDHSLKEARYLGLTQAPYIESDGRFLTVYTPRFAYCENHSWPLSEGQIYTGGPNIGPTYPFIPPSEIGAPLQERRRKLAQDRELGVAAEIVVGDEKVTAWVQHQAEEGRIDRFSQKTLEYWQRTDPSRYLAEKERYVSPATLLMFYRLEKALGRVAQLPETLEVRLEGALRTKRLAILAELEKLSFQEQALLGPLEAALKTQVPRIPLGIDDGSYERDVAKTEAELRIIQSVPIQRNMERVRGQIVQQLKRAFIYDMHQEPRTFSIHPRPGITQIIDVPELIKGYCEGYKVALPTKEELKS